VEWSDIVRRLRKLDEALQKGRISEETYNELRTRYRIRLRESVSISHLTRVLRDIDYNVQAKAFRALGMADPLRSWALIEEFRRDIFGFREDAVYALGELGALGELSEIEQKEAIGPLIATIRDKEEFVEVRACAALALGKIKDVRAVMPLIELLDDPAVSKQVIFALGEIGDEKALKPLKNLLETLERLGGYEDTRKALKEAIEKIQKVYPS